MQPLYFKQNPSSTMYFNQGLLGPDLKPNGIQHRNPLRNRKLIRILILLFAPINPHFSNAAFSPFILLPFLQELKTIKKKKKGQIIPFLKMMNETCVPNPDPEIPHNYGSNRSGSGSGTHASCRIFTIN